MTINSLEVLKTTCSYLQQVGVCPGNNDDSFIRLLEERGGEVVRNKSISIEVRIHPLFGKF